MATSQTQYNGLARFATLCAAASWWLQWGTGTTAAARSANVVTTTTTTEARSSCTTSTITTTQTGDTLKLVATITAAEALAVGEVGAFDAVGSGSPPTGGNMDVYGQFSIINLATNDSIAFTVTVQFT